MQPVSQILLRNEQALQHNGLRTWINPPPDLPGQLFRDDHIFCQDYRDHEQLNSSGFHSEFGVIPVRSPTPADSIVLNLPREKERLVMMSHLAASTLAPDGVLWVAGENRSGIKSSPRHLQKFFSDVTRIDSARHCVLFKCTMPIQVEGFNLQSYETRTTISVQQDSFQICGMPGVFSRASLDPGTSLLLENLPKLPRKLSVLDLGCGSGVIGTYLLIGNKEFTLTFSDANALALKSTESTLTANNLTGTILASDGFSSIEGRFDLVITNPPFHRGHKSDLNLSPGIFQSIRNFLNPGGQLIMVANQHLPYHEFLRQVMARHEILAANSQYKLYQGFLKHPTTE